MANVLSQEEVDSLLSGIGEGQIDIETDISEADAGLKRHAFSKNAGQGFLKLTALQAINVRFINLLNRSLSRSVGKTVDVTATDISSFEFGDFCRSLSLPSSLNIFSMKPLPGYALLVLEGSLVFALVEILFGSKTVSQAKSDAEDFTPIETRMIERVVSVILSALETAWSEVSPVELAFTRRETSSQFVGIASPEDMIIADRFAVDISDFSGLMTICLPHATIEPIRSKLQQAYKEEVREAHSSWRESMDRKLRKMDMQLVCDLGTAVLSGREILGMKTGDVIQLDQASRDEIVVNIEGVPKFSGRLGNYKNKYAVQILSQKSEG